MRSVIICLASLDMHAQVELWYREHHGWLYGWLRRRTGCSEQAAELAQDVFVRLLLQSWQEVLREPRAYMTSVAKSVLVDHWRRAALQRAWEDALAQLPSEHVPSLEQQAELLQTLQQLDDLLQGLPPKVREAFLLSRLDGLPQAEIARRLGVSLSSVEKYLAQALRHAFALL